MRNPGAAMHLRNIITQSSNFFRPVGARNAKLEDIEFKDVAIIIVESNDRQQFRIEADLDKNLESIEANLATNTKEAGQDHYQVGVVKHFKNDRTNLRMQIEVLDFEKYFAPRSPVLDAVLIYQ